MVCALLRRKDAGREPACRRLDAVASIREEFGVRIPALVISGDTSIVAAHAVRAAGFALLPKPVVPGALAAAASALVASAAGERRIAS